MSAEERIRTESVNGFTDSVSMDRIKGWLVVVEFDDAVVKERADIVDVF